MRYTTHARWTLAIRWTRSAAGAAVVIVALVLTWGCDGDPTAPASAYHLEIASGDGQIGPAGSELPQPLVVRVRDGDFRSVEGIRIAWSVEEEGGSVITPSSPSVTDQIGRVRVGRALGEIAGSHGTTAAIMEGGQTVRFTSIALVQGATHLTPKPGDSGDQQRDTVLATLEPFRVIARDHLDAPVAGVTVKWSAYADGALDIRTSVTDDDGMAETRYRLPTQAGTLRVQASVEGLIGSPIAFEAHAEPATPTNLVIVSGDEQVALPSSSLAPYAVRAIDAYGNAVEGVVIDWQITEGGGSIDPATSTTAIPDAATQRPLAMTTHTLSPIEGPHLVTATATSVPGTPRATFRARAVSGIVWVYTYYYYGWNNAYSGFEPDEIVVPAGGTVAWLWGLCDWGCDNHDVTFEDDPTEPASSPTQREGSHFRTFDQPGVFPYHCSVHSGEGGVVEVVAGEAG